MGPDLEEFPADAAWLQLPDETPKAYAAFCCYRNAGPLRSLRKACQGFYDLDEIPPPRRTNVDSRMRNIQRWSSEYEWVDRANAYTNHLDTLIRMENLQQLRDMHRRHAAIARVGISKAAQRIRDIVPADLTVREAIALAEVCSRNERSARESLGVFLETVDEVAVADRRMRDIIAADPNLALCARELALALEGVPQQDPSTGGYLTPYSPANESQRDD